VIKVFNVVKGYLTPSGIVHIQEIEQKYLTIMKTNENDI